MPKLLIVMGSDSDLPRLEGALSFLDKMDVSYEARVCSAHRSPDRAAALAKGAEADGVSIILAAAGLAAHLPGVLAAMTPLPVIGIPVASGPLQGVDALLAIVQMPPGIPVATVGIDAALNAAVLACRILALSDPKLRAKLMDYMAELEAKVLDKDQALQAKLSK